MAWIWMSSRGGGSQGKEWILKSSGEGGGGGAKVQERYRVPRLWKLKVVKA